jgi:hypothetical protein
MFIAEVQGSLFWRGVVDGWTERRIHFFPIGAIVFLTCTLYDYYCTVAVYSSSREYCSIAGVDADCLSAETSLTLDGFCFHGVIV